MGLPGTWLAKGGTYCDLGTASHMVERWQGRKWKATESFKTRFEAACSEHSENLWAFVYLDQRKKTRSCLTTVQHDKP